MLMRLSHTYMISEMADHKEGTKILEQWHSEDSAVCKEKVEINIGLWGGCCQLGVPSVF